MTASRIDENIYVTGQIELSDIDAIAKAGIKVIIDNRPDGEQAGQPTFKQIEKAAKAHGIKAYYVPVTPGQSIVGPAEDVRKILDGTDDKVLMYCKSGSRSAHVWGLSQSGRQAPEQILGKAAQAGFDIRAIAPGLEAAPDACH